MTDEHERIKLPEQANALKRLNCGEEILLSGTVLTARDQAHKRFVEAIGIGKGLPVDLKGKIIFYAGPSPGSGDRQIGSIGPTTSVRMDSYLKHLLNMGIAGTIGKGPRSAHIPKMLADYGAVYLHATGGIAAYLGRRVTEAKIVAYEDLGCEAVWELRLCDFPLIVAIDAKGRGIF